MLGIFFKFLDIEEMKFNEWKFGFGNFAKFLDAFERNGKKFG